MWDCWLSYFGIVKIGCIQDLELSYMQPSCCRVCFSAAKILPNPKLEKVRKKIYTRFKQAIRLRFTGISSR